MPISQKSSAALAKKTMEFDVDAIEEKAYEEEVMRTDSQLGSSQMKTSQSFSESQSFASQVSPSVFDAGSPRKADILKIAQIGSKRKVVSKASSGKVEQNFTLELEKTDDGPLGEKKKTAKFPIIQEESIERQHTASYDTTSEEIKETRNTHQNKNTLVIQENETVNSQEPSSHSGEPRASRMQATVGGAKKLVPKKRL